MALKDLELHLRHSILRGIEYILERDRKGPLLEELEALIGQLKRKEVTALQDDPSFVKIVLVDQVTLSESLDRSLPVNKQALTNNVVKV